MSPSPKKKKAARWAYLDELDGLAVDDTPIRKPRPKPAPWELVLYATAPILWAAALYVLLTHRPGATGLTLLGVFALCLRTALYEIIRRVRCRGSLLGTVESFTRPRTFCTQTRYPVIRFTVGGETYRIHGTRPVHPSTLGNEEWVRYNPADPADSFVTAHSKLLPAVLAAAVTGFLGVAYLILELN